jgi:hypothetical protein
MLISELFDALWYSYVPPALTFVIIVLFININNWFKQTPLAVGNTDRQVRPSWILHMDSTIFFLLYYVRNSEKSDKVLDVCLQVLKQI